MGGFHKFHFSIFISYYFLSRTHSFVEIFISKVEWERENIPDNVNTHSTFILIGALQQLSEFIYFNMSEWKKSKSRRYESVDKQLRIIKTENMVFKYSLSIMYINWVSERDRERSGVRGATKKYHISLDVCFQFCSLRFSPSCAALSRLLLYWSLLLLPMLLIHKFNFFKVKFWVVYKKFWTFFLIKKILQKYFKSLQKIKL